MSYIYFFFIDVVSHCNVLIHDNNSIAFSVLLQLFQLLLGGKN